MYKRVHSNCKLYYHVACYGTRPGADLVIGYVKIEMRNDVAFLFPVSAIAALPQLGFKAHAHLQDTGFTHNSLSEKEYCIFHEYLCT